MLILRKLLVLALVIGLVVLAQQGDALAYGPTLDPMG